MDVAVNVSGLVLAIGALAFIAGGAVLYRGSRRVGWRAVGVSAVAFGTGALLVVALTTPVFQSSDGPGPVVFTDLATE